MKVSSPGQFLFAAEDAFESSSCREQDAMELISAEWLYQQFSAFLSETTVEEDPMEKKRPTEEEIRERAYELFLGRGGEHGNDVGDWLEAERELRERYASPQEIVEAAASR